jgi:F-type H+-transporting ATPase subunit epsilon
MKLRITTPLTIVVDEDDVQVVSAEDASGWFGIQPRHADFLTSLAVSVVSWKDASGKRQNCAVDGGLLTITGGNEVDITTREAIPGDDLATLARGICRHDAGGP